MEQKSTLYKYKETHIRENYRMGISKLVFNAAIDRGAKFTRKLMAPVIDDIASTAGTKGLKFSHKLSADVVQLSKTMGKHKIPRFLYHITSRENYQQILESGVIHQSFHAPNGVYMIELDSFSKY